MNSTVTIGMPVFNDIDFIEESIISILNQTHKEFILILSDDGATDGSELICLKYAKLDSRITYIKQKINLGISKNMKFLLNEAKTEYFMWAGDDDLWHPDYLVKTIDLLCTDPNAIVAFSKYKLINEQGDYLKTISNTEYQNLKPSRRLNNFIKNANDGFGYGVFRTKDIKDVQFPTWKWPNKKTPYNNIYPSLCFYLSKGNYIEYTHSTLFFKRIKTNYNTNHKLIGQGNAFKETFAFIIRRFNLITTSSKEIRRGSSVLLMLRTYPILFYHWFIVHSYQQIKLAGTSFIKNRVKR